MKHISLIYIILASLLIGTSCKESFLDRAPETSISDAEFWKSASDLQLYANNWYTIFPTYTGFGTLGVYGIDADGGSDNMITLSYNSMLNAERVVPATGGGWDWTRVRNVNYFLANYSKSTEAWDVIGPYVGEAYFFRAYFYYTLLKQFGDLPWINQPLVPNSPELYDARISRGIIVDSMLNDLDKAIEYLPSRNASTTRISRINKQIAQLFQARVALYEGTWEKYHSGTPFGVTGSTGEKYLQKAAQVTDNLIANPGGNALDPLTATTANNNMGYWGLFNQTDYRNNTEVMLFRHYIIGVNAGHNWHRYTLSGAGRGITKNMVDAYLCTDGSPISTSSLYQGDNTLLDVVKNRDPRMVQSIYINDNQHYITTGGSTVIFQVPTFSLANEYKSATGYQLYKGHNPSSTQQVSDQGTTGAIYFRFAEALLINAEAKAELGTVTQQDLDNTINKLRSRVSMPNMILSSLPSDSSPEFPALSRIINEVRRERRVELAFEGFRLDDLFRWAAADEKIFGLKPLGAIRSQWDGIVPAETLNTFPINSGGYIELFRNVAAMSAGYKFNVARDYLYPLPTDQLTLNPALTQNPGW
ncbi:RagB/SusD family nutrient uptake outer membrane protein [Sphingobacterium hungaricum]|uniref:RagB/SusD family nutrient uptake outer membrane protein n=1 Tax=Sphingobacterium hungaricum TaxID=2082723 RepID=A0A928YR64_9SPHI|nr:RagB/SusD family nutrient uptake outer membrane protein [Sphingobacterium hungaricum]MBE8714986.1 RagB/SusD family nutrient uptake outer membrane protein [Sphingobacterium hungaricum]